MSTPLRVPYHRPSIGPEEIESVIETLHSGWLTTGVRTARFEKEFPEYVNAPYAQAVKSCTSGLHLVLSALGIGPGDEVITTPLTFCATVNVILHVGATPVLADVRSDGNFDPESIARRITPRTRAILPVHLAGLPCSGRSASFNFASTPTNGNYVFENWPGPVISFGTEVGSDVLTGPAADAKPTTNPIKLAYNLYCSNGEWCPNQQYAWTRVAILYAIEGGLDFEFGGYNGSTVVRGSNAPVPGRNTW
jgi:hypothetical protein